MLKTNSYGIAAIYFDTKGHGGDNFQFKACGYHLGEKKECLYAQSKINFTVWRRIYVDFAWMEEKGESNSVCAGHPNWDYPNDKPFEIISSAFNWVKGAYDDSFIEVIKTSRELGPNDYLPLIYDTNSHEYAESTGFHPADYDTFELIGADHFFIPEMAPDQCVNGGHGNSVPLFEPPDTHFHSFVFVGEIYGFMNRWGSLEIDRKKVKESSKFQGCCASHELLHLLLNCDNNMHDECLYGLTFPIWVKDNRSYMHHEHVNELREGKHSFHVRGVCSNTAGISYLDLPDQ